jgi:hypothetical protein
LIERLRAMLAGWSEPARLAILFGSVACGQANAVERSRSPGHPRAWCRWRAQLLELQRSASAWTGNDARIVEYDDEELGGEDAEPLFREALADEIELFGSRRTLKRLISRSDCR